MRKRVCFCLIVLFLVVFFCHTALAAGFGIYPAILQGQGLPGASGSFPGYIISNGTSVPFNVGLSIHHDQASCCLLPPADWFGFNPDVFLLEPGAEKTIELLVAIPSNAEPGDYEVLVQAKAQGAGESFMNLNLALNARLRLTVLDPDSVSKEPETGQSQEPNSSFVPVEPASDPVIVKKHVWPESDAVISTADGALSILIPSGSVSARGEIVIKQMAWPPSVDGISGNAAASGFTTLSQPYKIEITDSDSSKPVPELVYPAKITYAFPHEEGVNSQHIYVSSWDDNTEKWIAIPTVVDTENHSAVAEANCLGITALLYRLDLPGLTDIDGHRYHAQILEMVSRGVVNGDENNLFNPESPVTRAQFAKMISIALGLQIEGPGQSENQPEYPEFKDQIPDWAEQHVMTASRWGLFQGDDNGNFNPNAVINRQEMAVVLMRTLNLGLADHEDTPPGNGSNQSQSAETSEEEVGLTCYSDGDDISTWARSATAIVAKYQLMGDSPDGAFRPANPVNRAEACDYLSRLLNMNMEDGF